MAEYVATHRGVRMVRCYQIAFVVLTGACLVVAQNKSAAPAASDREQWLERAKFITRAIEEDTQSLAPNMQALLAGRLAELWRTPDPARSKAWLDASVSKLTAVPEQESTNDRQTRLETSYALLTSLNKTDPSAADRMLDSLISGLKPGIVNPPGTKLDPETFNLGVQIQRLLHESAAEHDLDRTAALAHRIIDLKDGNGVVRAFYDLQQLDPMRADQFAGDALRVATRDHNWFLMVGLTQILMTEPGDQAPSEQLSNAILNELASGMLRVPENADDRTRICQLASSVAHVIDKYPVERQAALRTAVEGCKGSSPMNSRNIRRSEALAKTGTPRELMEEAKNTDDDFSRAQLKLKAAREAQASKDYLRALDIIKSLTPEERDAAPDWPTFWMIAATEGIHSRYQAHDPQAIERIIADAPDEQRVSMMLTAAMAAHEAKDVAYSQMMLTEARRNLEKYPVTTQYQVYLTLLSSYGKVLPSETASVLPLVVEGINNFKPGDKARMRPAEPGWHLQMTLLPDALLDADPQMVWGSISEIKLSPARAAMRLGLLQACLRRYSAPQKNNPPERPAKPLKATKASAQRRL